MMHTEGIRDVIRYIRKFKGSTIVIRMDDDVVDSPLFSSHIHDLALLHETGIRIVLIPGAHEHISRVLDSYGIAWKIENTIRITSDEGMNFIKMAAFDVSNRIMTRLSAEGLTAVIGNWVRARGRGVLDGTDFGSAGFVDKIQLDSLLTALEDGFIPIIPCIGWTSTGKPYNISSTELAVATATALKAGKLFFLGSGNTISIDDFTIPESASLSPEGRLAALSVESIDEFLELNRDSGSPTLPVDKLTDLLLQARTACLGGVTRAHILDADIDGVIPAEIFSDLGSGTMIYVNNYGTFRAMTREDIPAVLSLMNPLWKRAYCFQGPAKNWSKKPMNLLFSRLTGASGLVRLSIPIPKTWEKLPALRWMKLMRTWESDPGSWTFSFSGGKAPDFRQFLSLLHKPATGLKNSASNQRKPASCPVNGRKNGIQNGVPEFSSKPFSHFS